MGIWATLIVAVTFIANLAIFLVVIKNNPRSWSNRLTGFLALIMAAWTMGNFLALSPGSESYRLLWVRLVMAITAPMGVTTYLLAKGFPGEKLAVGKMWSVVLWTFVLTVVAFAMSPWMFVALQNLENGSFNLTPGPAIVLFAFSHLGFTTWGLIVLLVKYKRSQGRLRRQLIFFVLGLVLTLTLITLTNFVAVVFFGSLQYTFIGPTFTLFLVGFTTYAIVKHRLFDVRALVVRSIAFTLMVVTMGVVYAGVTSVARLYLFPETDFWSRAIGSTMAAIIIAFSFQSFRRAIEKITDKFFYKDRYDTEETLGELTRIMAAEIDLSRLSKDLLGLLVERLRVTGGAIVWLEAGRVKGMEVVNRDPGQVPNVSHVEELIKNDYPVILEEMAESEAKEWFRANGVGMAVPLTAKSGRIGVLFLGLKRSGDMYSNQDLDLLTILAPEAAVALENARSYKEIQEFSRTLEQKVEERTRELRESQKRELELKDEFVFIATHDLRTPVTAIDGYLSLIKNDGEKFSASTQENMRAISEASNRLKTLVQDLLEVARSDSGTMKLETKPVDVGKVIEQCLAEVKVKAQEKKVALKVAGRPVKVLGDVTKMPEIFENLLSNAVKFNREGGEVRVEYSDAGQMLQIVVADTGYGIPKDEQAKVFTKFFKIRTEDTKLVPGTGLGLFVVRMLVEKMGGQIRFESVENQGTKFIIKLPKARPTP